ncbi:inositol 1,4,5-trisphosphate receptor-interacting protein [Scleropages formosus]|uniref:Inositol 1,4,5-trisphosphate receptor-interacting protein n=1 Tax=Scleropages formosus TaxID=113540 RepID=A0A8C9R3T0_SCLFO|nr:inositol 1,4,5-trisphosphate receptor-interacting protein-like [Scleropages formosus]
MQITVLRVYMMVAAAIFNPLLLRDNTTISESDDEILTNMKDLEEHLMVDQRSSLLDCDASQVNQDVAPLNQEESPEMLNYSSLQIDHEVSPLIQEQPKDSQRDMKETSALKGKQEAQVEDSISWYIWEVLILVILHGIKVLWQNVKQSGRWDRMPKDEDLFASGNISVSTIILNTGLLRRFYERNIYGSSREALKVRDFVEGFADDLLKALRSVCDTVANIEQEPIGVGSMYELWRSSKPLTCDLIIPFTPPEPYKFKFQLWCSHTSDVAPDLQGCGRIKVEKVSRSEAGCPCDAADLGEDLICLLHDSNETPSSVDAFDYLLCEKNSSYLSKDYVLKWFQMSSTKAWETISHKYDFDLQFPNHDSPWHLKVRFRSGITVAFNITPVVKYEDTDTYFISHFPTNSSVEENSCSIDWCLSFAVYEKRLLRYLAKNLPPDSCHIHCLQTLSFLHKKQILLTGKSALSMYHFKTALLHVLLSKKCSDWGVEHLKDRLCDVLGFLEKSLKEKKLDHILIGNSHVPQEVGIPAIFCTAKPVNLFSPFASQRQCYSRTVEQFQELLRNVPVLIQEYTIPLGNGNVQTTF